MSINVNGIRSAIKKGLFAWLAQENADVICLQEIRISEEHLTNKELQLPGYHSHFYCAQQKGYSGVAIYSKKEPDKIIRGLGWNIADDEGRYIEAIFGNLHIASLYLPSGTSGDARQAIKYDFLDKYLTTLQDTIKSKKQYIICGDWNIAHKNIDLKNWRSNQDHSGFLPAERSWLDTLFDEVGYVDAYRYLHPNKIQYTWWSNRGQAWANNTGWRIDYHVITPNLADKIMHADVYREQKFSDHAPLTIDYAMS